MAKVKFKVTDPETGESEEYITDEEKLPAKQKMAAERGVKFELVDTELSPEQQTAIAGKVGGETSMRESFMGGIMQGVSLGSEDDVRAIFGDDTETLRRRQEAEHPYVYGAGKFLGSLVPAIGGAAGGAAAGGAVGGPPGAVVGGLLGAGLTGAAESYASKPKAVKRGEGALPGAGLEDVGAGALSMVGEGVGRALAPVGRALYRGVKAKITPPGMVFKQGVEDVSDQLIAEATTRYNQAVAAKKSAEAGAQAARKQIAEKEAEVAKMAPLQTISDDIKLENALKFADYRSAAEKKIKERLTQVNVDLESATRKLQELGLQAPPGNIGAGLGTAVGMGATETETSPEEAAELTRLATQKAIEEEKMKRLMALTPRQ